MINRLSLAAIALVLSLTPAVAQTTLQPIVGEPIPGLTPTELAAFNLGKSEFQRIFVEADGLGPVFNDDSCAGCHNAPGIGGSGNQLVTRFGGGGEGDPFDPLANLGGSLLQANSINPMCAETIPLSATIIANRVTPLAVGLGLIEAIPEADIVANESIAMGLVHWVPVLEDPMAPLAAGRFGWKAQLATVLSFSADASQQEMGITSPVLPIENLPNNDPTLSSCDTIMDPEDTNGDFIDAITAFQRFAAQPPQTPKSGMTGETVFTTVGCADCHVASAYTTGTVAETALSGVSFKPYTDFLLHDMGALGDGIVQGQASETQFRTPPLWGLRFRDPMIHDGRAAGGSFEMRVEAAIAFHAGEGQAAADAYDALPQSEKDQMLAFLGSLGRREFDSNGDNNIDTNEFLNFRDCFTGPGSFYTADDPCAVHDVDQDGDVDLDDFDLFLTVYIGPMDDCDMDGELDLRQFLDGSLEDCNNNLLADSCEIADGFATDANMNGVPDDCETEYVRGDIDANGNLGLADVIGILGIIFGGAPTGCEQAADVNGSDSLALADPIDLLNFLFQGGAPPAAPYPDCGLPNGTPTLSCDSYICP